MWPSVHDKQTGTRATIVTEFGRRQRAKALAAATGGLPGLPAQIIAIDHWVLRDVAGVSYPLRVHARQANLT